MRAGHSWNAHVHFRRHNTLRVHKLIVHHLQSPSIQPSFHALVPGARIVPIRVFLLARRRDAQLREVEILRGREQIEAGDLADVQIGDLVAADVDCLERGVNIELSACLRIGRIEPGRGLAEGGKEGAFAAANIEDL